MAYIDAGKIKESIEALEYLISGECTDTPMDFWDEIELAIRVLKSYADVAEVKHGEWLVCGMFDDFGKCSNCDFKLPITTAIEYTYCPNCGAKMDGGSE